MEVFVKSELGRVYEYGENNRACCLLGKFYQAQVPFVQCAHSHDNANTLPVKPKFFGNGLHL